MICYSYDGVLYPEDAVDQPPPTEYRKVEIPDSITLSASDVMYADGSIVEILNRAGQLKKA